MNLLNDNLYDQIRLIREQLLNRIEILEDEVDYLTEENMYYSKQLYQLETDIDRIVSKLTQLNIDEGLEYQEGSKEVNKESKETS